MSTAKGPSNSLESRSSMRSLLSLSRAEVQQVLRHHDLPENVLLAFQEERADGLKLQSAYEVDDIMDLGVERLQAEFLLRLINEMRQSGVPALWLRVEDEQDGAVDESAASAEPGIAPTVVAAAHEAGSTTTIAPSDSGSDLLDPSAEDWNVVSKQFHDAKYLGKSSAAAWLKQNGDRYDPAKAYLMVYLHGLPFLPGTDRPRAVIVHEDLQRDTLPRWLKSNDATVKMHAEFIMGCCCSEGIGRKTSPSQAAKWWRKSADQGHAESQFWLAWCFHYGEGVPLDHVQAASWYRMAAEQGHAFAQCILGSMYLNGKGVPLDRDQATEWYRKSAAQGHPQAKLHLKIR